MGVKGGKVTGVAKGFASNLDLAREAGRKGGRISRRGPAKKDDNVMKIKVKNKSRKQYIEVKITPEPAFRYEEK